MSASPKHRATASPSPFMMDAPVGVKLISSWPESIWRAITLKAPAPLNEKHKSQTGPSVRFDSGHTPDRRADTTLSRRFQVVPGFEPRPRQKGFRMNITPAPPDTKRRALGKGLDSLLPRAHAPAAPAPAAMEAEAGKPRENPNAQIDRNPFQTRSQMNEEQLAELAASITANGVVQPVLVRPLQ